MDGLVSSFQFSSSRFTTSLYDKGENDKTTTTTTTTTTQTAGTAANAVSERDANGGNQGGGNGGNGGIATAIQTNGVQFGSVLGNAVAQEAIVNRALELVQSVRETMFGELTQALGFSNDIINKVSENQAFIEALNGNEFAMSGFTLEFSTTLVSGAQSQSVNVSVSLSQSFLTNNFDSKQLSTYTALRNMVLLTGENPQIDTLDSWIRKAYDAYGSSSSNSTSISSLTRVEFSSISLQTLSNANSTNVNVSLSTTSVNTSIVRWQGNDSVNLIDPLIIDLGGDGVELSDDTFSFDLDADGESDQISRPKGNSGFLALDKNGDGIINDGTELFGTQNGDGFKDLARYDSNGDGKIDKDDPIYDKLRIWKPGANGDQGELIGLGEVGIGAIYLDAKNNEQLMQSTNGETLGVQRKSAAYQRTDGSEGQIYHVDLAKRDEQATVSKDVGIAAYHKSQNDLDLLRTLVGNTKNEETSANNTGNLESITQLTPAEIRQQIEEIKQGNVSEENLALVQLDALLGKAKNNNGLTAILNRVAFDGNLSSVNDQFFNYQALVNAQRLLA
ncbi:MAG: hypothetical protein K2N12_01965 [Helicobacter sp.]|nr:hypothetical protein [Helicobacter sp.]